MNIRHRLLLLALTPSLSTGCIVTKDMNDDDTADDAGSTSSSSSSSASTSSSGTSSSSSGSLPSESDDATTNATAPVPGATTFMPTDTHGTATTDATASSSTTAGGEELLCEDTGGIWDETSCGHYDCGNAPECDAVVPGCDCGPTMNFVEGMGCVEDPRCLEAVFPCGDMLDCVEATEYCEIFVPGVPGPSIYSCMPLPAGCIGDATCACLDGEGIPGLDGECTEPPEGGVQVQILAP